MISYHCVITIPQVIHSLSTPFLYFVLISQRYRIWYSGGMKRQLVPTMLRLTPRAKKLLETASFEQRRSQAAVVEHLILNHLYQYAEINDRLNIMLAKKDVP